MASAFKQVALMEAPMVERVRTRSHKKTGNFSPVDWERIAEDYIDTDMLENVTDDYSAREAMRSLLTSPKRGLVADFRNLLRNSQNKEEFVKFLVDYYARENIRRLLSAEIKLGSGRIVRGYRVNTRTYLRVTKAGLRAVKFKTGRFTKLPKRFKGIPRDILDFR